MVNFLHCYSFGIFPFVQKVPRPPSAKETHVFESDGGKREKERNSSFFSAKFLAIVIVTVD